MKPRQPTSISVITYSPQLCILGKFPFMSIMYIDFPQDSALIMTSFLLADHMAMSGRSIVIDISSGKLPRPSRSAFTCESVAVARMFDLANKLCCLDLKPFLSPMR